MSIKLKEVIYMQTMATLIITPSKKEYWFYIDHSYTKGSALMEMTEEKIQILESTIISMETHEAGGAVFYVTEPETQEKAITIKETTKFSSEIVYIYQEQFAYSVKPSEKMKMSIKKEFGINVIEVLPKSMYSMEIEHLSVNPTTNVIEAYIK